MGERSPAARYVAEFVGTFMLVFTIGCNVLTGQPVWGAVSIACILTVMIYALGKSSGAHFNPAVSLSLALCNKLEKKELCVYMGVQLAAGTCAGLAYSFLFENMFNLEPTPGHSWIQAGAAETIYTFMLCFVVLNVAASNVHGGNNEFYGLAIGFVIVAGAYGAGSISMGCFNPAVAAGIDVSSASVGLKYCFVYAAFEFTGAVLAAALYRVVRPDDFDEIPHDHNKMPIYPDGVKMVSEFIGTYILVLTVGLNVLGGSPAGAFSIAAALMCMIYALGTVSGAHFNPAVTLAIMCSGRNKCSAEEGIKFMIVQVAAGICAAFTYSALENGKTFELKPEHSTWTQVFVVEMIFTFVLAFVVLSVATAKKSLAEYFGFAIAMCVTVGGFAIGKVSGGALNPAVAIGISSSHLLNSGDGWPCLIYTLAELVGGGLAAVVFQLTQPSEFEKEQEQEVWYGSTAL